MDTETTMVALRIFTQQELGPNDTRCGAPLFYGNRISYNLILSL